MLKQNGYFLAHKWIPRVAVTPIFIYCTCGCTVACTQVRDRAGAGGEDRCAGRAGQLAGAGPGAGGLSGTRHRRRPGQGLTNAQKILEMCTVLV